MATPEEQDAASSVDLGRMFVAQGKAAQLQGDAVSDFERLLTL